MKPEQRVWHYRLKPCLDKIPGMQAERVELRTGASGMPDVMYTYFGSGWIENKYSSTTTYINLKEWTKVQRIWARKHIAAGAKVLLCVGTARNGVYILDPTLIGNAKNLKFKNPHTVAWFPDAIDSSTLREILRVNK